MQEDRWLWVYLRTIKARLCFMSMHIINLLPLITFKIHNDPWLPRVIITRGSDLTGEFPSAGSHSSLASSLFSAGSVSQLHGVSACANLPRPGVLLRCSSLHTWSVIVQHISVSTELIFLGVVLLRPSTLFFFSNYLSARFLQTNQVKIVLNDKHSHYSPNYLFKKLGLFFDQHLNFETQVQPVLFPSLQKYQSFAVTVCSVHTLIFSRLSFVTRLDVDLSVLCSSSPASAERSTKDTYHTCSCIPSLASGKTQNPPKNPVINIWGCTWTDLCLNSKAPKILSPLLWF